MGEVIDAIRVKLYQRVSNQQFCDVILVAALDGTKVCAHRVMLSAASAYFDALLASDSAEIPLSEISGPALQQLIKYCYIQRITIDDSNVHEIYSAAHLLSFDDLVVECEHFYLRSLNATNALSALAVGDRFDRHALQLAARPFVPVDFLEAIENEEFRHLGVGILAGWLACDRIQIVSETAIFHAIEKWIEFDRNERKQHYAMLMKAMRMSKIEYEFLISRIREYSEELGMLHVFSTACEAKCAQDVMVTDVERKFELKSLFVVGTMLDQSARIERYSIGSNAWELVPGIAWDKLSKLRCIGIDQSLYLIGDYAREVMCVSLSTMQMTPRKSPVQKRMDFAAVTVGQYVYVIGGSDHAGALRSVERYDTRADDWVRVSSLNHFRRLAEAVVLAGKIYVIGGFYNGNRLRSVERYDPRTDEWTDVAELNVARYYHRCCTINGSIYVVGGCSYRGRAISSIEQFDAQINKWTIIPFRLEQPRYYFGISVLGKWIYIAGGKDVNGVALKSVRRINVFNGKIETLASLQQKLFSVNSVMIR